MKRYALVVLLAGMAIFFGATFPADEGSKDHPIPAQEKRISTRESWSEGHCTIIYASNEEIALGGGNEDWDDPTAQVKFEPPEEGKYGVVYFGFVNSAYEAGMNDQGLFFDAAATSPLEVVDSLHKINSGNYPVQEVMDTSATVEEALAVFNKYNLAFMEDFQLMFGDSLGNSAILEGDEVIYKQGRYQIVTNFYQSKLPEGILPGRRYRTAESMFSKTTQVSVELFRMILDATHQEGSSATQYSNIYDLTHRKVYVFYLHDYEKVVEIDLEKLLRQGARTYDLSSMFAAAFPTVTDTLVAPMEIIPTSTMVPPGLEGEQLISKLWWGTVAAPIVLTILLIIWRKRC